MFKSKITKFPEIDYSKVLYADGIEYTPEMDMIGQKLFFGTIDLLNKEKEDRRKVMYINKMFDNWNYHLFQQTGFVTVAKHFVPLCIFDIVEEDLAGGMRYAKNTQPNLSIEKQKDIATGIVQSTLVWLHFAKLWGITVSDKEVDDYLDDFYRATNKSIREFKNDKDKYEHIRTDIVMKKTTAEINNRFVIKLNLTITIPRKAD
ncbi:MAG: hypothetical protein LBB39_02195 [Mycoplasmataceae bacterium]|nr:hypothetical protein [Mycoplasmataceae bacterium]